MLSLPARVIPLRHLPLALVGKSGNAISVLGGDRDSAIPCVWRVLAMTQDRPDSSGT